MKRNALFKRFRQQSVLLLIVDLGRMVRMLHLNIEVICLIHRADIGGTLVQLATPLSPNSFQDFFIPIKIKIFIIPSSLVSTILRVVYLVLLFSTHHKMNKEINYS